MWLKKQKYIHCQAQTAISNETNSNTLFLTLE